MPRYSNTIWKKPWKGFEGTLGELDILLDQMLVGFIAGITARKISF